MGRKLAVLSLYKVYYESKMNLWIYLYQNKYIIQSIRLKNYDYCSNGYYFVTIYTHKKICYFGDIKNDLVNLSKIGEIAEKYWL